MICSSGLSPREKMDLGGEFTEGTAEKGDLVKERSLLNDNSWNALYSAVNRFLIRSHSVESSLSVAPILQGHTPSNHDGRSWYGEVWRQGRPCFLYSETLPQ